MNVEDVEDRLRRAIEARTSSVEPSPDALGRINEKLSDQGDPMDLSSTRTRWIIGVAAAIVLVAALLAGLMLPGGDDRTEIGDTADRRTTTTEDSTTTTEPSGDRTTTTEASGAPGTSSTTTSASSTTTTQPAGPSETDQSQIVWPRPSSDVRFDTPEAAARSFARYYARFRDPVVGAFRPGDSRSGEVPVHAFAGGPETTVLVRQLAGDSWFVIGAQAEHIELTSPTPGPDFSLGCPQHVAGTALAFEGTVQVRIDAYQPDGSRVELGSGFVTGSGSPPAGPYEGNISCRLTRSGENVEPTGILTLWEPSAEDGSTLAITAIPLPLVM